MSALVLQSFKAKGDKPNAEICHLDCYSDDTNSIFFVKNWKNTE